MRIHSHRQKYLFGRLAEFQTPQALESHLTDQGFEKAILAWMDPGEILSMRRLDGPKFQYHIRLFSDGEIRGHYEYSSEGNPWGHSFEKVFDAREEIFREILGAYLEVAGEVKVESENS